MKGAPPEPGFRGSMCTETDQTEQRSRDASCDTFFVPRGPKDNARPLSFGSESQLSGRPHDGDNQSRFSVQFNVLNEATGRKIGPDPTEEDPCRNEPSDQRHF